MALESSTEKSCAIFLCTWYVSIPLFSLILPSKRILSPAACRGAFWCMQAAKGLTALFSCLSVGFGCPVLQPLLSWKAQLGLPAFKAGINCVSVITQQWGKWSFALIEQKSSCLTRGSWSPFPGQPNPEHWPSQRTGEICSAWEKSASDTDSRAVGSLWCCPSACSAEFSQPTPLLGAVHVPAADAGTVHVLTAFLLVG